MTEDKIAAIKPNRRQLAKAETRAKVVTAARCLFFSVGFEATTIRDIAKDAGMSTGAVFANFADKAELYREIFDHDPITPEQGLRLAAALRGAEAFVAGFEGDDLQDGIDALLSQTRAALECIAPAVQVAADDASDCKAAA